MNGLIFLYGAPASGKTTLGRKLGAALGAAFVDLDAEIVAREGRPIPDIFATDGERVFRDIEARTLAAVIDAAAGRTVVSLGGGTLLRDANRALCERAGTVFCLDAPDEQELARRIGSAAGSRPAPVPPKIQPESRRLHIRMMAGSLNTLFIIDCSLRNY